MNKEKQIEEMAQKFCPYENNKRVYGCDCYKCQNALMERCETLKLATETYNAGYRKINENEVVISKEEYEEEITGLKEENKELNEEINTFNHLCNEWVKTNNQYIKENQQLEAENEKLKNQLENKSKEMAEKYQARIDELEEELDMLMKEQKEDREYEIEQSCKEMAERNFNTIIKVLEERKDRVKAFYGNAESVGVDIAINTVKIIAKQFGIDLGES